MSIIRNALRHPLGRRRKLRTLAAIAHWQARSRFASKPVDIPWVGETRLLVERGMTGATGNIYFGLHEVPEMAFVAHFLRSTDTLFDVGANIGSYALLAAGVANAKVVAFEPHPRTAGFLERNVAHNRLASLIAVRRLALSDKPGRGALTDELDTMNHLVASPGTGGREVALSTLDLEAATAFPTMLKIDVEGHEHAVLAGATTTLADRRLAAIEIETVTGPIEATLLQAGFLERWYDPFSRRLQGAPIPGLPAVNRLFVRDPDAVQERLASAPPLAVGGIVL